jgi:hypothetical protein
MLVLKVFLTRHRTRPWLRRFWKNEILGTREFCFTKAAPACIGACFGKARLRLNWVIFWQARAKLYGDEAVSRRETPMEAGWLRLGSGKA